MDLASLYSNISISSSNSILLLLTIVVVIYYITTRRSSSKNNFPPVIKSRIPFFGSAFEFGRDPVKFLLSAYDEYGPVVSFTMMGKTFTYLLGSEAAELFFVSKNDALNAEDVYSKLTTPVFGPGVVYDIPNHIFLQQKKIGKSGLNSDRFRTFVPKIQEETNQYFLKWKNSSGTADLFHELASLIIFTASRCLLGDELRQIMDDRVAGLLSDLDKGFRPEVWLLPEWFPLPVKKVRDRAHREIYSMFSRAVENRRKTGERHEDLMQTFIDASYTDGRLMNDAEVVGLLIGMLLAGQHTSSTTSSWMGLFIAKDKALQDALYEEQMNVRGTEDITYDHLDEMHLLDRCLKETLRLRPPLITTMRLCKTPLSVVGYDIPPGHQVCISSTVNHMLKNVWHNATEFDADRFLDYDVSKLGRYSYIPFGQGRHRCIGESFAYVQIKTIWAHLIQTFEVSLVDGHFPEVDLESMIQSPKEAMIYYKPRI